MSDGIKMQFGRELNGGFTVKNICGCRVVFGPIPVSGFSMLIHGFSKKALMSADIANKIGASLVIGEPNDIEALRKMDLPVSEKRHADYLAATHLGLHKVAMWLRNGELGASSNAMCKHLFGVPAEAGSHHPYDPDDLRRCLLFLDACDAHDKVPLMADASTQWACLVARWDDLMVIFREEMAAGKTAPRTYALMKELANDR